MINVVYNEILVYDVDGRKLFPNSNLISYDVHPWHTMGPCGIEVIKNKHNIDFPYTIKQTDSHELISDLNTFNCHDFIELLDNNENDFRTRLLDEVYETKEHFIYPFVLYNNDLFSKYDTIELPEKLIELVKKKLGRICFYQPTEGFYGQSWNDFIWVSNLSKKYGFDKEDIIVVTPNMKANEQKYELIEREMFIDNFTIFEYSYFQHNLWFTPCRALNKGCISFLRQEFEKCLLNNKENKKTHHFLSFNRITKLHRVAIFAELMTNKDLIDKSIVTLAATEDGHINRFYSMIDSGLVESYKHSKERLLKFYQNYDSRKSYTYDFDDLYNNKASNLNVDAHKTTFVNVVTESLIHFNSVFFSEKTFKPMTCAQPFIILGNPHSIRKLKEYGFMTFDRWWDESYDDEFDFAIRLEKIVDVLKEIASWDMDKCYQVTQEMEEVFVNNFNVMVSDVEVRKLINLLRGKPKRLI